MIWSKPKDLASGHGEASAAQTFKSVDLVEKIRANATTPTEGAVDPGKFFLTLCLISNKTCTYLKGGEK